MLKLARLGGGDAYQRAAEEIVTSLGRHYLTPLSPEDRRPPGMLVHACYFKKGGLATDSELIWGDYYFLEALALLTKELVELF